MNVCVGVGDKGGSSTIRRILTDEGGVQGV